MSERQHPPNLMDTIALISANSELFQIKRTSLLLIATSPVGSYLELVNSGFGVRLNFKLPQFKE
ncbi:hypothetical protein [Paenibacillus planticolens]|uniref:hypothetical protein n=1 Tax=Paenibacillus planticolens TaxID=2654976 RepID=UPI0014914819|nr:hypothetical protein [Paenibacillus planticolens]